MVLPADERLLTGRRLEVIRLAARGLTAEETALEIRVALETVKSHRAEAQRILGARNISHAVAICLVRGLIQPHEVPLPGPRPPLRKAKR